MALWATCYQLGSILAKSFATLMLAIASAAWSFWGASIVMLGVWILFFLYERDKPEDVGLPSMVEEVEVKESEATHIANDQGWKGQVMVSILWMGSCYFVFKFLRYALDSWSPLALTEIFGLSEAHAGYVSTAFDWVGFVGVIFAGWASDKFFQGRRTQIIVGMTVGMTLAFLFLATIGQSSVWMFGIGLSLCGFMLMGPDSLLSGVGAIDVGGRRQAVIAAGIINGLGSIGPIIQEEVIGYLLDHHGYDEVFPYSSPFPPGHRWLVSPNGQNRAFRRTVLSFYASISLRRLCCPQNRWSILMSVSEPSGPRTIKVCHLAEMCRRSVMTVDRCIKTIAAIQGVVTRLPSESCHVRFLEWMHHYARQRHLQILGRWGTMCFTKSHIEHPSKPLVSRAS